MHEWLLSINAWTSPGLGCSHVLEEDLAGFRTLRAFPRTWAICGRSCSPMNRVDQLKFTPTQGLMDAILQSVIMNTAPPHLLILCPRYQRADIIDIKSISGIMILMILLEPLIPQQLLRRRPVPRIKLHDLRNERPIFCRDLLLRDPPKRFPPLGQHSSHNVYENAQRVLIGYIQV